MKTVISRDGDMLDAICARYYGREAYVTALLAANKHLASMPAILPAGLVIALPDLPDTLESDPIEIRLWG